jgi:alpha-beta hydrolase superfamily lysophospholipase
LAEPPLAFTVETFAASDGYQLQYRRFAHAPSALPFSPAAGQRGKPVPKARAVFLHGIQSHGGWYEHSCQRLAQAGYEVFFLDRRGSGLNQPARGDAPSYRRLLQDLVEVLDFLGAGSSVPRFLAGISWGAKLAVALERWRPGQVDGLVFLCPGFFPRVRPPRIDRWRIFLSRLRAPDRLFTIPLDDPELFTATPRWQRFIRDDPLSLRRATARLLFESARLDHYVKRAPRQMHLPVLLLLAERDRIIDNEATRQFINRFAATDRQIIEYPGAHHTLEFEPDPERFVRDLLNWLERHLPG